MTRDLRGLPDETFRQWWAAREQEGPMKTASISRQVILDRIRKATGGGAPDVAGSYAGLERSYVRAGKLGADERIALMIERLREYDAEVVEAAPESLAKAIAGAVGGERAAQIRGSGGVAGGVAC